MSPNVFIIFLSYCASFTVLCADVKKDLCRYDDQQCITEGTKLIYPVIIAGKPGEVEPSDPVLLDEILIEDPNIKFVFTKAYMRGLSKCRVEDVVVTADKAYFDLHIWCPSITIGAPFEAHGKFDGSPFEGNGESKITYNNFKIWIKGYYDKYDDEAGDLHAQITNFDIELHPEEVIRHVTTICFDGQHCEKGTVEETRQKLELYVRKPIIYNFMKKAVKNINSFLKIVPIKDIHYQSVAE